MNTRERSDTRGFSTLEVVIALSVFLVIAAGLTSLSLQMVSSATRTEARLSTAAMLDKQLASVAALPFEDLLTGFVAPDACGNAGSDSQRSCVQLGNREYRVSYAVRVTGDDQSIGTGQSASAVEVTASTVMTDGETMSKTRVVTTPSSGYFGTDAVVRVVGKSDGGDMPPMNVLNNAGQVVLDGVTFTNGVALLRVPGDSCTAGGGAPCRLALSVDPNSWWGSGDLVLYPENILGSTAELELVASTLTEARVKVGIQGSAVVRVRAQASGAEAVGGAPQNTVCIWGSFFNGTSTTRQPYCNTSAAGDINISSWSDPGTGASIPFPSGLQLSVSAENPSTGYCQPGSDYPNGGPNGNVAGAWVPADVCTTWTWGTPELFSPTGDAGQALTSDSKLSFGASEASYDLVYLPELGRPATGSGSVPAWSKPRDASLEPAAGCAVDSDPATLCVNSTAEMNLPTPETTPVGGGGVSTPGEITISGHISTTSGTAENTCMLAGVSEPDGFGQDLYEIQAFGLVDAENNYTLTLAEAPGSGILVSSLDRVYCAPPEEGEPDTSRWKLFYDAVPLTLTPGGGQIIVADGITALDGAVSHTGINFCSDGALTNCAPVPPPPSGVLCPTDPYCFSTTNLPPQLNIPGFPYTVNVTNFADTPFVVTATDPEGDPVQLRVTGTEIYDETTGAAFAQGEWTSPNLAPANSWSLRFSSPTALTEVTSRSFELTDGNSSSAYNIGFYSTPAPYTLTADDAAVTQGDTGVALRTTLYDTSGGRLRDQVITMTSTVAGLSFPSTATTDSNGIASFALDAATTAGGLGSVTFTAGTVTTTVALNVARAAASIAVTQDTATHAQGSSFNATAVVTDYHGDPLAGTSVVFSGATSGVATTKIRPTVGGCVTDAAGSCTSAVLVASSATVGAYTLLGSAGDARGSSPFDVTATVYSLAAGDGRSGTDAYASLVRSASPSLYWTLDQTSGPMLDANGTATVRPGTVTANGSQDLTRGVAPLGSLATGAAMRTRADGARVCSTSGANLVSPTGATIEAWVELSSHKPSPSAYTYLAGLPGFYIRSGDGVNQERATVVATVGGIERVISGIANPGGLPEGGSLLSEGTAHHLIASVNNGVVSLYDNGALVAQGDYTGQALNAAGALCVGSDSAGLVATSADATFDEVSVYPYALSAAGVQTHFSAASVSGSTGTITGQQGELLSFEVTVRDGTGAPMSAATVTLASQDGSLTAGAPAVSNADGVATLNVAIAPSAIAGQLLRALQVSSGSYTQDLTVTVEAVPASVSLTAASVVAGGESPLLATVTDYTGNPVSGQRVQFSWPSGTAPTGLRFSKSATTDANGVATGVVTPSSAVQDGEYTIRASVAGLSVDSELSVIASGVGLATNGVDFTPSVIASGSTGTWVGHVVNENGRPAAGVEVSLSCEACGLGFSPGVVTSGEGGVVSFTVTDTGGANPPGRYSIDVSLGGVQTTSRVTVTGVATALSVESDQISVRRGENLMVSVTATDASGAGVGGVQVTQLGDSGATVRPARTTGAGVARVRVTAPEVVGVLTVTLQSGTASVAVTLEVLP